MNQFHSHCANTVFLERAHMHCNTLTNSALNLLLIIISCYISCVSCTLNVQHHSVAVLEEDTAVRSRGPVLSRTSCLISTSLHLIPPLPVLLDYSGADKTDQWLHIRISEHRSGHTHTHTEQTTSLQLPGASTSVGPHRHRVILCNKVLPPLKIARPSTPETALLYRILSTWSCFSAATGHEQDAVVKWHSIFSARLLCFLSPLPVITDNMQVSVHPVVYFI